MIETPQTLQTGAQPIALIHITIPRDEIRTAMGPGYQELMAAVSDQGLTPTGPWLTHHLRMDPEIFDFEIAMPIAEPITPTGRVVAGELPAATVIRTIYHGSFEGLGEAWTEFDTWIQAQGHTIAPNLLERYLVGPETSQDPADWRTELNRVLVK